MTDGPDGGAAGASSGPRLGLRANLAQFGLLVAVNALVGGPLGQERTVLPLLARQEFGLAATRAHSPSSSRLVWSSRSRTSPPGHCPTGTGANRC